VLILAAVMVAEVIPPWLTARAAPQEAGERRPAPGGGSY
jgi:hypothetical protein